MKFLWIFSFVGRILKIRSVLTLMEQQDRVYYTSMYFGSLVSTFLLVLIALFHTPDLIDGLNHQNYNVLHDDERDNIENKGRPKYPLPNASLLSRLTFWWTNPMVKF